jgi:hypothetical protein
MERSHLRNIEEYGPDPLLLGFWMVLTTLPTIPWIYMAIRDGLSLTTASPIAYSLMIPVAVAVFALRFRVRFTDTSFVYRRWARTIEVDYSEIVGVHVTRRTPVEKAPIGAFLITGDGKAYPFWPKLFSRKAIRRFMALGPLE